jgi:ethanolamine utilization protein EutP (predicted NTPase)
MKSEVGTISATDADGDTLVYSISGTESAGLSIDPDSGALTFIDPPDYETKTSYNFTLGVNDGNSTTNFVNMVNIYLNNLNDNSPIFSSNDTFTVAENESIIGTASATDADTGSSVSYSVDNSVNQKVEVSVAANANGSGNVYVISGVQKKSLFLEIGKTYSFEHPTEHPLRFSETPDGTHGGGVEFTTGVDTSTDGVTLLTVSSETPALYYYCSIHSGMGNEVSQSTADNFPAVSVNASSGVLTFSPAPDFETLASFSAKLSASDGEIITDQNIQVNITDVDPEGPVFSSDANFTVDENQTAIGTVAAEDPFGASVSYTLSGTDASAMTLDASSGELVFNSAPDYETKVSYSAIVTATGGTNATNQNITITIKNLNEYSPIITSNATFNAAENQTSIGTVTATDADTSETVTFSITSSDIEITSAGVLTFTSAPDYETQSSYSAKVTATDGTNSTTQDITVSISDVNDNAPVFTSPATFSAAENQTSIGTVAATDADTTGSITFSVSGAELSITSGGILTFVTAPDYESKSSYSATVTAADGTNSTTQDITVSVTNLNDNAPVFTSPATFSAAENQTVIGNISASDVDGDAVIYSINGADAASISINSSSGVLAFISAPDYETKTSYAVTATASDGVNSINQSITINISDINDNSPVFTSSATFSAAENQTSIGTVTATDADATDSITFSISGTELSITSAGVLTFTLAPDYETTTSLTATVTATDGINTTTQDVTVSVTDVNDNSPVFTSSATFSVAENQSSIGTVTTTDADNGNTISYSVDNAVTQKIEVSIAANSNGSGNVYVISGVQKKSLTLEVGKTYQFDHPTAHPFRFSTTVDGIHGSGSAYTAGVDTSTSGVTLITVSSDTPTSLYYYCNVHSGMGSDVTSSSNSFPAISAC